MTVLKKAGCSSVRGEAAVSSWTARLPALLALGAALAALLLARNPQTILAAEFWAEDGWAWFPDAYTDGVRSLARPVAGYLQTVSRLVGLLAQAFPLPWAPTVFAVAAVLFQVLPPVFLVSARMADAWGGPWGRLLFAVLWAVLPNTREVYTNLTNSQWHLATLAFLVLLSRPAQTAPGRAFDGVALAMSGLSGPFCVILAPVAAIQAWLRRDRASLWRAGVVFGTAAVQAVFVLSTIGERSPSELGASPDLLARIVAQQVLVGALGGEGAMEMLRPLDEWQSGVLPTVILGVAAVLTGAVLVRGPWAVRLAVLAAALLLGAAMARPQISPSGQQWVYMLLPGVGQRYYLVPMLAWLAVLFAWAGSSVAWRRVVGVVLLLPAGFGVWSDWSVPQRRPTGFGQQAKAFTRAPPGTVWVYPFNPMFEQVPMRLVR